MSGLGQSCDQEVHCPTTATTWSGWRFSAPSAHPRPGLGLEVALLVDGVWGPCGLVSAAEVQGGSARGSIRCPAMGGQGARMVRPNKEVARGDMALLAGRLPRGGAGSYSRRLCRAATPGLLPRAATPRCERARGPALLSETSSAPRLPPPA